MKSSTRLALLTLCGLASASAQDNLSDLFNPFVPFPPAQPQAGRTPPQGQRGPWENDVIVYHAKADGSVEQLAKFDRAGVPTINRMKDGRLIAAHQHFPENDPDSFDKVAIHFSSDEGKTWTDAAVMKLNGLPEGMRFPFDPTLVTLPDGRVRMYFTSLRGRQFDEDLPRIHSAISTDGIEYTYEPGVRFSIEGRTVIDCAVALHRGVFHLYSPDNGEQPEPGQRPNNGPQLQATDGIGYHATSTDGLNFTRADDVKVEGRRRWLGNAQSDGRVITFFGTGEGVFTATSEDGANWQFGDGFRVMGADPGAVAAKDGGWIVTVTGPPRNQQRAIAPEDRWLIDWTEELWLFDAPTHAPPNSSRHNPDVTNWPAFWSQGQAEGTGPVQLSHLPMRAEDIKMFTPYGLMVGGHVCPIDHCYFYPKDGVTADVIAPADGFIVVLGHRTQLTGSSERGRDYDDYALTIEHSGTFYTQYDLLTSLDAAVLDALDATTREQMTRKTTMMPQTHVRIPVKAGQIIGKVGCRSLDFGVVNFETKLAGFLTPSHYGHYSWRTHLVSPFDYLDEPLKTMLQKLSARKAEPLGGKIDYDIDGKLIGNWFREGSGGYAGDRSDPRGYWMGHLAIAYHHIDPTNIVVSIGDFGGKPAQYWVKGNTPDPATISEKDGVVKYELIYGQLGSNGNRYEGIPTGVQGTVLAQLLSGRKLSFEAFPGRQGTEVTGFTHKAMTFER